jgi:uncharacterized protein YyaL (SSP411 family)
MNGHARRVAATLILMLSASAFGQETTGSKKPANAKPPIYDVKADAREQIKTAGMKARRDNQRILVMFGGDWCGWCHKLHALFNTDKDIRKTLLYDYQLVMVDTKAPNAEALLKECQGELDGVGFPFLAVLDADGKILTRQKTDPFEIEDHHDPKKVKAFLDQWVPEKVSAEKVIQSAFAKASSEDKRILLHFGAPWCGWCHKLEDFLAREDIASRMGKDFLDVKVDVDRMIGAEAVVEKYRKNLDGGIPWFVFLDPKGEAFADSDGPKGNIGYPATAEEIAHFMSMLKKAVRRMDDSDQRAIEDALKTEGAKIQAAQRAVRVVSPVQAN